MRVRDRREGQGRKRGRLGRSGRRRIVVCIAAKWVREHTASLFGGDRRRGRRGREEAERTEEEGGREGREGE